MLHGSNPGHALGERGLVEQLKVQSGSHPEPCTFIAVPQSHCSPLSRVPLPHEGLAHR